MARKKAEIALQQELETQEEWEEYLAKEGLSVIDIYQEWAGPCKSMVSILKRLKNEVGDDLLRFAVAKTDTIDALERYRGKCEPCFMLFAGGVLVAIMRGANSPLLLRTITEQLAYEHKVIDGNAERKEIKDPLLGDLEKEKAALDEEETEKDEEGFMTFNEEMIGDIDQLSAAGKVQKVEQEVTVCIIKPDAIQAGKKDDILEQLKERGIEVLADEERQLTEEEVKEFYAAHAEEEYFEELVKFMSSGPSHVLVLSKGDAGIIDEFRDLLGPKDVDEAKENAPESLRAKFGTEKLTNALHASDSKDRAHAELAFFFPTFAVPTRTVVHAKPKKGKKKKEKKEKAPRIERTLALIRPDALANHKDEILAKVEEAGFQVALQKEVQLTKEQAEEFYKEHKGEEYFDELTTKMSSGPLLALGLARVEAISGWRDLLGPKEVPVAKTDAPASLRAQYSVDEDLINPLHGSDTATNAEKELDYFFPVQQTVAVVKPDAYQTKEDIMNKIRESGFRIAARQETELNSDIVEAIYSDHKDKEYFNDLSDHMTSGPTLFMVLSRHDAVEGWRSMMGPTDPEKAKEENPDCIRAQFGTNIKSNAVHGASTEDNAKADIKLIFGDLEFNKDGTVKGEEVGLENETLVEEAESEEEEDEEEEEEEAEALADEAAEQGEEEVAAAEEIQSRHSSVLSLRPFTPKSPEEKITPKADDDDFFDGGAFKEEQQADQEPDHGPGPEVEEKETYSYQTSQENSPRTPSVGSAYGSRPNSAKSVKSARSRSVKSVRSVRSVRSVPSVRPPSHTSVHSETGNYDEGDFEEEEVDEAEPAEATEEVQASRQSLRSRGSPRSVRTRSQASVRSSRSIRSFRSPRSVTADQDVEERPTSGASQRSYYSQEAAEGEQRPASAVSAKGEQAAEGEEQKEGEEGAERPSSQASQKQDEEQKAEGEEGEQTQETQEAQEGEESPKQEEGEQEKTTEGEEKGGEEKGDEEKGDEGEKGEQDGEAAEPAAASRPQTGAKDGSRPATGEERPATGKKTPGGEKESQEEDGKKSPEGGKKSPDGGKTSPDGGKKSPDGGKQSPEGGKQSPEGGKQSPDGGKKSPDGKQSPDGGIKTSPDGGKKSPDGGKKSPEGEQPSSKAASEKAEEKKEEPAEEKKDSRPPTAEKAESVKGEDQKEEKESDKEEKDAEQTEQTEQTTTEETDVKAEEAEEKKEETQEETQEEAKEEEKAEEQQAEVSEEKTEEQQEEKTEEQQEEKTEEKEEEKAEEKVAEESEQAEEKKEDAASTKGEDAGEASDDKKDEAKADDDKDEDKDADDKPAEEAAKKED